MSLVRGKATERQSLVAFVTLKSGAVLSAEELREYVADKLPRHLVPNRVEIIDEIPTLPNGKLDRMSLIHRASEKLTRPEVDTTQLSDSQQASDTELKLAEIWATILSMDYVESGDDFFELGGHSLLATRLVSSINQALGCKLSVADLFDHPVLSDLAKLIDLKD